jgi:hypothetical protein
MEADSSKTPRWKSWCVGNWPPLGAVTHGRHAQLRFVDKVQSFRSKQKHTHDHGTPLGEVITVNITKLQAGMTSDGGKTYQLNVIPASAEAGRPPARSDASEDECV